MSKNMRKNNTKIGLTDNPNQQFGTARQRRNRKRSRRNQQRVNGPYEIKDVKNAPIQTRSIRYSTTSLSDHTITSTDLLEWVGFATTTTAGYSLCEAIKIRHLRFTLAPDDTTNAPRSCTFKWQGTNVPHDEVVITAFGGVPATISLYPPAESSANWWQSDFTTATPLFSFDSNSGDPAILDIHFEWVMLSDPTSNALTSITGATANTIVYPSQPATGTSVWFPVGLPSG